MKLYDLAYACRLYQGEFDYAYKRMCNGLGQNPALSSPDEQTCLLQFLKRLRTWASQWISQLPDVNRDIRGLNENERLTVGHAYEELLKMGTGLRFQDTAAAKTLHALRRNTLPMWDAAIKDRFISVHGLSSGAGGQVYLEFIGYMGDEISDLEKDVTRLGYSLNSVCALVRGDGASLVKLVDEYHWITITECHQPPSPDDLEQWLGWIH
jgi:hypothetical protein